MAIAALWWLNKHPNRDIKDLLLGYPLGIPDSKIEIYRYNKSENGVEDWILKITIDVGNLYLTFVVIYSCFI